MNNQGYYRTFTNNLRDFSLTFEFYLSFSAWLFLDLTENSKREKIIDIRRVKLTFRSTSQ